MARGKQSSIKIVGNNWSRFQYVRDCGHDAYVAKARQCERFYLGGGRQWNEEDKAALIAAGRPAIEVNGIFPAVNSAIGLQLHNRMDISFKPRGGGADQNTADVLSKVSMQIADDIHYPWAETQVFSDGLIQQRGYFDFRISFLSNMLGVVDCDVLDPLDVMPDPDATDYDPETWSDVIISRWLTLDDITQLYGQKKADEVELWTDGTDADDDYYDRNHFGDGFNRGPVYTGIFRDKGTIRVRVIDRQHRRLSMERVFVYPTGEMFPVPGNATPEMIAEQLAQGAMLSRRTIKRIRWTVSTSGVLLHDDWSPYRSFTIVPYFPYFRRGITLGMIDNAISPQELFNKATSQYLHIINTSANSGWTVEENSLVNMSPDDLEQVGAKTGLVVVHRKNSQAPRKIEPNRVPTGIDRIADKAEMYIKTITGMSDAMQGLNSPEVSGVAIQSKQYMGQMQLGGPLDNLTRTRHLAARKVLELIQDFYTEERVIMITDDSDPSEIRHDPLVVNQQVSTGKVLNDLTIGEYDVVITDVPSQATFQDNQFQQALAMREKGIAIPDKFIVSNSSLSKKAEIIKAIEGQGQQQAPPDPDMEAKINERTAKAELLQAQAEKTKVETVSKSVEAQYSAMQSAGVVAAEPDTAPIADQILHSAGFQDQDKPPIIAAPGTVSPPEASGPAQSQTGSPPPTSGVTSVGSPPVVDRPNSGLGQETGGEPFLRQNTNPLTPPNPEAGILRGIETARNETAGTKENNKK